MSLKTMIPCGDPPLSPPEPTAEADEADELARQLERDARDLVKCCVCEEEHSRLELIDFGNSIKHEHVCLEMTCLVDFITRLQEENSRLALNIVRMASGIRNAI